jgi:hypothetical protein
MRPLKPAAKPSLRYPRLAAAWALLAGSAPGLALADATVPAPGKGKPDSTGAAQIAPPTKKPPCATGDDPGIKQVGTPRKHHPMLRGGVGRAHPVNGSPFTLALHPHGPEEPCHLTEIDKKVA